jgi:GNAT superfamily N-acetyltransferase
MTSDETASILRVSDVLPDGIERLAEEAAAEGYRHMGYLVSAWRSGENRFAAVGEALLAAFVGCELAGVGGVTCDPAIEGAYRMRRFFVSALFRRRGIARAIAEPLINEVCARPAPLFVNAGTRDGYPFWQALGFAFDARDGHSHVWRGVS